MNCIPTSIKADQQQQTLILQWNNGVTSQINYSLLRKECPCAACISELTGERLLDPSTISQDIHPENINFTGNYALQIDWSDGHTTGIYTWERLAGLCQLEQ